MKKSPQDRYIRAGIVIIALWVIFRTVFSFLATHEPLYAMLTRDIIPDISIPTYRVAIALTADGRGSIEEYQEIVGNKERDFPSFGKSIYRHIPTLHGLPPIQVSDVLLYRGKNESELEEIPVTVDSADYSTTISSDQNIGSKTDSMNLFKLVYTISGLTQEADGRTRLAWNPLGSHYQIPIEHVSGTIYLPRGITPELVVSRALVYGMNEPERGKKISEFLGATLDSSVLKFEQANQQEYTLNKAINFISMRPIIPGESILIVLDWPAVVDTHKSEQAIENNE